MEQKAVDTDRLIDEAIGAAAGSEEERKKLAERLKRNERTREKKRREKKRKEEERKEKEEERRRVEEEESGVVAELNRRAHEGKEEEDDKLTLDIGMRKVTIVKSLLRNEPNSSLYQQAVNSEGGRELVCLMKENTWSVIFDWLNT